MCNYEARLSGRRISVVADAKEFDAAAAAEFARLTSEAVSERGRCTLALAGGSTPIGLYRRLATEDRNIVPWSGLHLFWGDERHVPPNHLDSNFRAISNALLDRVPIRREHVHRVRSELPDAQAAAADYEDVVRREFALDSSQWPAFASCFSGWESTATRHHSFQAVTRCATSIDSYSLLGCGSSGRIGSRCLSES
jgi:Glucosamine-6-phosphate isomerases/6-phosphogluconolactonase